MLRLALLTIALFVAAAGNAEAAALGSLATSVGVFSALAAVVMTEAWLPVQQAHSGSPALGAAALAGAVALLWLGRRMFGADPGGWRHAGAPEVDLGYARSRHGTRIDLPEGIDRGELLAAARDVFLTLQSAWDGRDIEALRGMTTPELLDELIAQLALRPGQPDRTEVVTLHAELLGFERMGWGDLTSIEFSGLIRECETSGAVPFRELWMLARIPQGGAAWRLAKQQALL